jgi:hypothetical protein
MWRSVSRMLAVTLLLAGACLTSVYPVNGAQMSQIQATEPAGPAPVPLPPQLSQIQATEPAGPAPVPLPPV